MQFNALKFSLMKLSLSIVLRALHVCCPILTLPVLADDASAPANPPGQNPIADIAPGKRTESPDTESASRRFLDTFGFHLLVVLLGIAMAFM